ncbi:MAG TPA: extracellular solute-binding protein [Burkholderiales bacterium]|nr:extracellular solute-binding protein [Burkholderiales bacterium]
MTDVFMRIVIVLFAALCAAATATAQPRAEVPLAMYDGPDREQRLLAGARKEGTLMFYTSLNEQNMAHLVAGFEKKSGIKVRTWRSNADRVLQRMLTEFQAGRFEVDVVHPGSGELEVLHREKVLAPVNSPHHRNLLAAAFPAHREWAPTFLSVWVQAYNTSAIKKEDLPRTYEDLLNPKWKGKLGIEAGNDDWFGKIVSEMGEQKGLKLFREMVATNGLSVRKGHTLLNNLVISGEVPFAVTMYNYLPQESKKKGAPIDWIALEPVVARANGVGVARRAPHPHAALLFYDFLISEEGQKLFAEREYVPASRSVKWPVKGNIKLIDPAEALDQGEKWTKAFQEIVLKRQ